ncbi:MAG: DNA-3-methyladenine glycosylase [Bacteroidales bacterium]|nr:DNA-3-methyladenine glycosylase [Bacteroidales bacterium]MCF8344113.1 DNA-3-methyladenine glycosylase [Bacteroidales bacterium]MCF8352224.1 DNA-3-methyladenine glycosylase [Bacteroidales bacterium]MCF8375710.1 DNA-3-methyladenine glycosylase [Bacteroidales bacterium]MCF8400310.1 DNA-3-methyladenine glycosylase [Bacteroidales bacterium]
MKLTRDFYSSNDVVAVAKQLLGKILFSNIDGIQTAGYIVETEAYDGINDKACHAFGNRRTGRTNVMFMQGGTAYVYLCYGIHSLFNVVTGQKDVPQAVLIRGIIPYQGIRHILKRRPVKLPIDKTGIGPGNVSACLRIHYSDTGTDLMGNRIWIEDHGFILKDSHVAAGPRVGVDYAGEDASLPYRFLLRKEFYPEMDLSG